MLIVTRKWFESPLRIKRFFGISFFGAKLPVECCTYNLCCYIGSINLQDVYNTSYQMVGGLWSTRCWKWSSAKLLVLENSSLVPEWIFHVSGVKVATQRRRNPQQSYIARNVFYTKYCGDGTANGGAVDHRRHVTPSLTQVTRRKADVTVTPQNSRNFGRISTEDIFAYTFGYIFRIFLPPSVFLPVALDTWICFPWICFHCVILQYFFYHKMRHFFRGYFFLLAFFPGIFLPHTGKRPPFLLNFHVNKWIDRFTVHTYIATSCRVTLY